MRRAIAKVLSPWSQKAREEYRAMRELAVQARLRATYELALERKARTRVRKDLEAGVAGFEREGQIGMETVFGEVTQRNWRMLLVPTYAVVGLRFGKRAQSQLGGKAYDRAMETKQASPYKAFEALMMSWIETQGLLKAKALDEQTMADLRGLIAAGEVEGLSVGQIAIEMRKAIPALSRVRARTIGRTEVHTAASYANHEAAVSMGMELEHKWLSNPVARTRPTHLEAGRGPWLPMSEPFTVGGYSMRHPGDDSFGAPAEEIINCRCAELQRTATGAG